MSSLGVFSRKSFRKTKLSFSLEKNNDVITVHSYNFLGVPFDADRNKDDKYHALIIGNNNYQSLPQLDTASQDAKAMQNILKNHYGFSTTLLIDVDRYQILSAFRKYPLTYLLRRTWSVRQYQQTWLLAAS